MSQDGWSNIHREPIIATCLHIPGKTFLHDAVDVGDVTKDAEYCANLAKTSIEAAERNYGCIVIGFVSDSESKMVKVQEILQEWRGKDFIVYPCSAHYVNLAQSVATPPAIKAHSRHPKMLSKSPKASSKAEGSRRKNTTTAQRYLVTCEIKTPTL